MNQHERSFGSLFSDLARETADLVRKEVQLAKVEVSQKFSQMGSGITSMGAGALVAFAGFLILLQALVFGIWLILDRWIGEQAAWVAPLIVGLIVAVIGLVMLQKGRSNLEARNLKLDRTTESLRRDRTFFREQMK